MLVYVNGQTKEVTDDLSLAELIALLEMPATRIAVEVNRVVVRRVDWNTTILREGDRLEVVHFVGGGCL